MKKSNNTKLIYDKKIDLVNKLVDLNKKQIKREDVAALGHTLGLDSAASNLAWDNFTQTGGKIDLRVKNEKSRGKKQFAQRKVRGAKTNVSITTEKAGELLKKSMHSTMPIGEFCLNNNISIAQYYAWIKELNVTGKILDRKILNSSKYAKLDIKLAIWLSKHPNSQRKEIKELSVLERRAYQRVIQVLEKYL